MRKQLALWLAIGAISIATPALAATKTYQVTGPVLDVSATSITVQKGNERWEIAKDASTTGPEVKKGDKVTIQYRMTATSIEAKPAGGAKLPANKK